MDHSRLPRRHGAGNRRGGLANRKTMGSRITPHLRPVGGMSAEFAAATSIAIATFAQTPISTTHAIGGSIAGVGATRGLHSVRWVWGTPDRRRVDFDFPLRGDHRAGLPARLPSPRSDLPGWITRRAVTTIEHRHAVQFSGSHDPGSGDIVVPRRVIL